VPLVIPFGVVLIGLVLLGLALTVKIWANAMIRVVAAHPHGGIKRIITLPLRLIDRVVTPGINYVTHELTKAASHYMHPLAHWFNALADWSLANAVAVGLFAERTALAFERLTTVVLPREIGKATRPISRKAQAAWAAAAAAAAALAHYRRVTNHLIHGQLLPQLHRLAHALDVTIPHALGDIRARVRDVETQLSKPSRAWLRRLAGLLWASYLLGLLLRTLARRFPWLFCRQVQGVGKRICSLDSGLLQSLLADTLVIAGLISVVDFAKEVESFMDVATPAIKGFVRETTGLTPTDYLG
jgi:hypothetical protein